MDAGPPDVVAFVEATPPRTLTQERRELSRWRKAFAEVAMRLGPRGSLWLAGANGHRGGELVPWPYRLSRLARDAGLPAKNVYARHARLVTPRGKPFASSHEMLFLHVRSLREHAFDKTPLREPHVFKDLEWGGRIVGPTGYHAASRTSRRYPEGGRDPGNVLYDARRAADGSVLAIEEAPRGATLARLVRATSAPGWTLLTNAAEDAWLDDLRADGWKVERRVA